MIKLTSFIFCAVFLYSTNLVAQDWLYGTSSNFTSEAFDVKIDSDSNSVITGYFSGQINFGDTILFPTNGNSDIFVAKINRLGKLIWTHRFGGAQSDRGIKLAIDPQNNIYITGTFFGSIDFGSTTLHSAANSKDFFIAKLNSQGNPIWARRDGGNSGENPYDIIVDHNNDLIVTGQFEGTSTIGNQTFSSQLNLVSNTPSFDLFLAKYDNNGNPIWSKSASAEYEDRGMAITCDKANNLYLAGQFSDTLNFLGSVINNQIYNAAFVSKITPAGDLVYFRKFAASMALPYDIELNDQEEIYITGDFLGTLYYFTESDGFIQLSNPYLRKIFLLKISNSGNYIWGRANGSNSEVSSRALSLDQNQDVYIGGYFVCNFDQYKDSSLTTGLWSSVGFKDVFVSKFNPSGKLLWNKQNGGRKEDLCYALANGGNDKPIYAGSYENNFIIPTKNPNLINYQTVGIPQYNSTWPAPYGNPQPNFYYYQLVGDDSKNIFVGRVLNTKTPNYYYYRGSITTFPFKSPVLDPNLDVYNTCLKDSVRFDTKTDFYAGPGYNITWNGKPDPDKNYYYQLTKNEMLVLETSTWDACYKWTDSILIQLYDKIPAKLSDDHNFNNLNLPFYDTIYLCYPDVAMVTPSDLCANCTFEIRYPDTASVYHIGTSPFQVNAGHYYTRVYNEFGCMRQDTLVVIGINNAPYNLIDPKLVLYDTIDYNDSLSICFGDTVLFIITDKNANPLLNLNYTYYEQCAYESFTELNWDEKIYTLPKPKWWKHNFHYGYIIPDSTGWYKFKYDYGMGYSNFCGSDVTPQVYIDSFFLQINPLPKVDVLVYQDGPICPGEFTVVNVIPKLYNFIWDGPGITWQSDDKDSIQVTEPGSYKYSGFLVEPMFGCRRYKEFFIDVTEKSPPYLFRDPADGTICPNDTVAIWIESDGLYNWIGTNGFSLGNDSIIQVTEQGFYYCNYTDPEGCQMVTQQVELREYTTPSLFVSPDEILCSGEIVLVTAIYFGDSQVQWTSPIISNATTITATQPGVYHCQVSQCGITIEDSIQIIDGHFDLSLNSSKSKICFGDTVILTAPSGLTSYVWNDFNIDDNSISVIGSGSYWVTATNSFGCTQTSDTISLLSYPESIPPPIADSVVCPGASITLTDYSPFNLSWYEDSLALQLISHGNSLSFSNIQADTIVYLAYFSNICPLAIGSVKIHVVEALKPPLLIGDSAICYGNTLYFETVANDSLNYAWYLNGNLISTNFSTLGMDSSNLIPPNNSILSLVITDACSTNSSETIIKIIPSKTINLNIDSILLCPQNPIKLFSSPSFSGDIMWINGSDTLIRDTLLAQLDQLNGSFIIGYGIDEYQCKSIPDTVRFGIPNLTYLSIDTNGTDCTGNDLLLIGKSEVNNLVWTNPQNENISNDSLLIASISNQNIGTYILTAVDDVFGCIMKDTFDLFNHAIPYFLAGSDTALCNYYPLTYYAPDLPYSFYWNGTLGSSYSPLFTETIFVEAVSIFGCRFLDSISVYISDCSTFGPNVITPNGDGINDFLAFLNAELLYDNYLLIINRWGNVMYEQSHYINNWNGHYADGGIISDHVYFYIFYPDGKNGREKAIQGYVHVNGIKD